MTNSDLDVFEKIQKTVKESIKKPEAYLSIQEHLSQDLKKYTKSLYDLAFKRKSFQSSKSGALPELIINNFDAEQIWQQLELENNEEFGRISLGNISKTLASKKSWKLPLKISKEDGSEKHEESYNESNDEENEKEENEDKFSQEESDVDITNDSNKRKKKTTSSSFKKKKRNTEVDDQFFKLDELNEFLKKEDQKELKINKSHNDDSSDEDNESIDLFKNFSESDEDEEDDSEEVKNGKSLKYADFFDSPESGNEEQQETNNDIEDGNEDDDENYDGEAIDEEEDDNKINQKHLVKEKKVKFNLLSHSEGPDSGNESSTDEEDEGKMNTQSSLEKRQQRLKKRIEELEKEAISEKPWQLKGETSASSRPKDSLLEEFVEFDSVTRPAPIMTEKTSMKLEDIIRARIKDKAWDDVEKKFKPVETPMEYKKKLVMNQEKSKESLAQIYENEYIKQREALTTEDKDEQNKEEPPEHVEIKEKMYSLFRQLDALSNFHYTPKPAKPEVKIVSNIPAINMEEVAPVAASEATLLAPEEIKSKPKGDLIAKSERTKTDMKRERRKKKAKQRVHANESKKLKEGVKQKKKVKKKKTIVENRNRNVSLCK